MLLRAVRRLAGSAVLDGPSSARCLELQSRDLPFEAGFERGNSEAAWTIERPTDEAIQWSLVAQSARGGLIEPGRGLLT